MGMEDGTNYFDSGGGGDGDIGVGSDFTYGYGADSGGEFVLDPGFGLDLPDNLSSSGDVIAWGDIGAGGDFTYGYGTEGGLPPDYAPGFEPSGGSDLFGAFFDYYSAQGYDDYTAMQMAAQDASAGSILTETTEQGPLPIASLPTIPLQSFYDYWQSPPYVPTFGDGEYFPLPPPPSDVTQPNLPPYCPAGQYHPYPIGHPQQNLCVAFPAATTNAPKPPTSTSGAPSSAPKPPAQQPKPPTQQQCPQGYYRVANGQCLPIPRCVAPGTVFDQARGICVPKSQAVSPLSSEVSDLFANLKNIPWWVWLTLGGAFLLSRDDGGGKKTTVTYRRAR